MFFFHHNAGAYSEPCQTSKVEPFAKIVNGFLLDIWLGSKCTFAAFWTKFSENVYCFSCNIKSGLWRFKVHLKWPKVCTISTCCFLGNDTKKWFLTNWGWDKYIQGVHEHSKFWKNFTVCWIRLWATNKYSFIEC